MLGAAEVYAFDRASAWLQSIRLGVTIAHEGPEVAASIRSLSGQPPRLARVSASQLAVHDELLETGLDSTNRHDTLLSTLLSPIAVRSDPPAVLWNLGLQIGLWLSTLDAGAARSARLAFDAKFGHDDDQAAATATAIADMRRVAGLGLA